MSGTTQPPQCLVRWNSQMTGTRSWGARGLLGVGTPSGTCGVCPPEGAEEQGEHTEHGNTGVRGSSGGSLLLGVAQKVV